MRKILTLISVSSALALTACGTMTDLHNKLADAQMQKKQLDNGKPVTLDVNLMPSASWGCREVGQRQTYDWDDIQMKGQFAWGGPYKILTDQALAYANSKNLNVNYINLQVPQENVMDDSDKPRHFTAESSLASSGNAYAIYFQCQQINPQHELGVEEKSYTKVTIKPAA